MRTINLLLGALLLLFLLNSYADRKKRRYNTSIKSSPTIKSNTGTPILGSANHKLKICMEDAYMPCDFSDIKITIIDNLTGKIFSTNNTYSEEFLGGHCCIFIPMTDMLGNDDCSGYDLTIDVDGEISFLTYLGEGYGPEQPSDDRQQSVDAVKQDRDVLERSIDVINKASNQKYERNYTLLAFPNPTHTTLNLAYQFSEESKVTIEIYTIMGQKVTTVSNNNLLNSNHQFSIQTGHWKAGMYYVQTTIGNKNYIHKVMKY